MPMYTDSNEIYIEDDDDDHVDHVHHPPHDHHHNNNNDERILGEVTADSNHRVDNIADEENQQQQQRFLDATETITPTTTTTIQPSIIRTGNDTLLGPYPPPPPPPSAAAAAAAAGLLPTTTAVEGTLPPPSTAATLQLPPPTTTRRSILRTSSVRRTNQNPAIIPHHQQRLSFLKRSSSGDSSSNTTTRTNSFRRLHPNTSNTNTNTLPLDQSDGSLRSHNSATGGSVNSTTTSSKNRNSLFPNHRTSRRSRQLSSSSNNSIMTNPIGTLAAAAAPPPPRRYKVGEQVLVQLIFDPSDTTTSNAIFHQFVYPVNRYGFLPNDPRCQLNVEYIGPYQYVLATVLNIHYEEIHPYYTVQRYDFMDLIVTPTGTTTTTSNPQPILLQQRADAIHMEPVLTQRHEMAAMQAALQTRTALQQALDHQILRISNYSNNDNNNNNSGGPFLEYVVDPPFSTTAVDTESNDHHHHHSMNQSHLPYQKNERSQEKWHWYHYVLFIVQVPFYCMIDMCYHLWHRILVPTITTCLQYMRTHANLFLYGQEPYLCRIRLTMLNFVVLCSTWFMFTDQLRLACFPHTADNVLAMINFGVWVVLILELFGEVYIRPDGYQGLLISEKAFTPTTVRYINTIHFIVELLALCVFIPEFFCLFTNYSCSERLPFSFYNAVLIGVIGPSYTNVFLGHAYIALVRIRIFSMVRHWKNMWVTRTFIHMTWRPNKTTILSNILPPAVHRGSRVIVSPNDTRNSIDATSIKSSVTDKSHNMDRKLTNASNIGTALMVINSYRSLAIVCVIAGLFPIVFSFITLIINPLSYRMTRNLQATNVIAADTSNATCRYLDTSIKSWMIAVNVRGGKYDNYLLTLDLQPRRCNYSDTHFVNVDVCRSLAVIPEPAVPVCMEWYAIDDLQLTTAEIADMANIRRGSIMELEYSDVSDFTIVQDDGSNIVKTNTTFSIAARFDHSLTIRIAAGSSVLLQMFLLVAVLGGLSILRSDVEIFVLGPLRRMLKIVDRYARNPLIQTKIAHHRSSGHRRLHHTHRSDDDDTVSSSGSDSEYDHSTNEELGSFETEQLITAVAKITDLLRKCWGVAGADIISTNLSTQEGTLTEVFNPTVPGKSVYALFGFVNIGGFDNALRNLGGEVMPLINDVAHVVHGEVFRWGFGDSGQCNKNLGSAFLMVFRIGLVKEVIDKLEQATDVVFSTSAGKKSQVSSAIKRRQFQRNSVLRTSSTSTFSSPHASTHHGSMVRSSLTTQRKQAAISDVMRLSLQSLPGISTFTDRAVIGMLKSYAGIYRDSNVLKWNQRLGASVGAFKIGMIFGMDAGWAVEGAVGSEYKIDATYLSPHVNMASRMMSACKQYDVTIMLSQAVQELMSEVAQTKLRHLDTVTVKGSSVKQKIYTYDARARGVDFFLHSRSDAQADAEAERYSPSLWNTDPDLIAMRQHVSEDFMKLFRDGHKAFLLGDWPMAIEKLEQANNTMFQSTIEDGYLEDELEALNLRPGEAIPEKFKQENGDGPSMYLISFMQSYNGIAPPDWDGWHPLIRK